MSEPVTLTLIVRINDTHHELGHIVMEGEHDWQARLADNLRHVAADIEHKRDSKETS